MTVVTRPSLWISNTDPSDSEPVKIRPFDMSYSTPSGMNPPRSATMVAGGVTGAAVSAIGSVAGAGGSGSEAHAANRDTAATVTKNCFSMVKSSRLTGQSKSQS